MTTFTKLVRNHHVLMSGVINHNECVIVDYECSHFTTHDAFIESVMKIQDNFSLEKFPVGLRTTAVFSS